LRFCGSIGKPWRLTQDKSYSSWDLRAPERLRCSQFWAVVFDQLPAPSTWTERQSAHYPNLVCPRYADLASVSSSPDFPPLSFSDGARKCGNRDAAPKTSSRRQQAAGDAPVSAMRLEPRATFYPEDLRRRRKATCCFRSRAGRDPQFVLADEPPANLDSATGEEGIQHAAPVRQRTEQGSSHGYARSESAAFRRSSP